MINKMTDEERKEAARVMASDGPWDFRARGVAKWEKAQDTPPLIWDWSRFEYRIRPAEPAPLPCCPWCGAEGELWTQRNGWTVRHASDCFGATHGMIGLTAIVVGRDEIPWRRRAPCPECAKARTEAGIRQQIAARAIERMQVAEARCAEADSRPGGDGGAVATGGRRPMKDYTGVRAEFGKWRAVLHVRHQTICVGPQCKTRDDAEWFRGMLRKALEQIQRDLMEGSDR